MPGRRPAAPRHQPPPSPSPALPLAPAAALPRPTSPNTTTIASAAASGELGAATPLNPGPIPLPELLEVAANAAKEGSKVVYSAISKPRNITYKGATDLVTETDRASEAAVLGLIANAYPDHGILGEEGGVSGNSASPYLWICDPIDGTTNFVHRYPPFAVSVGLLYNGEPIVGCVVEFLGGPGAWGTRAFAAHKGGGAYCNGHPIHVSDNSEVARSLLVTGFGNEEHALPWKANMELFQELTHASRGVRRLGSAATDLCHVALGIVDATWEYRLKPWDVTGGIVILLEAGGRVTQMDGQPYSVFSRSMLASNAAIHPGLLGYMQPKTEGLLKQNVDLSPWLCPPAYQAYIA